MPIAKPLAAALLTAAFMVAGCAKKEESPIERAVDKTRDALEMRDHEKLKDAGESATEAVKEAKEGVKDAVEGKK